MSVVPLQEGWSILCYDLPTEPRAERDRVLEELKEYREKGEPVPPEIVKKAEAIKKIEAQLVNLRNKTNMFLLACGCIRVSMSVWIYPIPLENYIMENLRQIYESIREKVEKHASVIGYIMKDFEAAFSFIDIQMTPRTEAAIQQITVKHVDDVKTMIEEKVKRIEEKLEKLSREKRWKVKYELNQLLQIVQNLKKNPVATTLCKEKLEEAERKIRELYDKL